MQAWEQFILEQEAELGSQTVQKWLRCLQIRRFDASNLYLEAQDSFQVLWFEEHMRTKVQKRLINDQHKKIKVHLKLCKPERATKKSQPRNTKTFKNSNQPTFEIAFDSLNPLYQSTNFIFHANNQLVAKFIAEIGNCSPDIATCNPIYFHGAVGSGKTHLLMALAHAFQKRGLKTIYVRCETFAEHVISAIRADAMSDFRLAYRDADVLIIDDVHILARKWATQEEFFHIFNTLHLANKQIVLAADSAPQELQFIEPRLISRFEWGIVLPLYILQVNERQTLLANKAQALNCQLPSDVAEFLIETFNSSPKALVKALEAMTLRLYSQKQAASLSIPFTKALLTDLLHDEQKMTLTPNKIVQLVAYHFGIIEENILGRMQTKEYALARKLAMYLCRQELKMPFMQIGKFFARDHSTVITSVKQVQDELDKDNHHLIADFNIILQKLHR